MGTSSTYIVQLRWSNFAQTWRRRLMCQSSHLLASTLLNKKDERLDACLIVNETELSLLSTLYVATAVSQWKRTRLIKLCKCKQNFAISSTFLLIEVSYERAEIELSRNVIFLLEFRYRPPNDFFFFLFKSFLITHAWNMHHMSCKNINNSRFRFFWDTLYMYAQFIFI